MRFTKSYRRLKGSVGAVVLEAALCAPITFSFLMLGLELGRIAQIKVTTQAVATLTSRIAGVPEPDIGCPIGMSCIINESDLRVGNQSYLKSYRQSEISGSSPLLAQRTLRALSLALNEAYTRLGTPYQTPQQTMAGWKNYRPIKIGDNEFFIVPLNYRESNNGADRLIMLSTAAGGQLAVKDNDEPNEFMACVSYVSTLPIFKQWICSTATFASP